jgi:hypothetical protein
MQDSNVGDDDARQAAHHTAVKSKVERSINSEIAGQASTQTPDDQAKVAGVAGRMRDRAVADTEHAERVLGRARTAARGSQFLDYGFYVLYGLLAIRLVLSLIGASSGSGFVRLINGLTGPFYAPFRGIVSSPTAEGGYTLVVPLLIAIVVYALLHAGINGALRMVGQRKTEI